MAADALALCCYLFFFNDTATTEIYTLSLHDALPISVLHGAPPECPHTFMLLAWMLLMRTLPSVPFSLDRKSTRLNSSHANISYAVFCLKKKKTSHAHDQLPVSLRTVPVVSIPTGCSP